MVSGISGRYTITNGDGKLLEKDIPFELDPIIVGLDESNYNEDLNNTKEC